MRRSPLSRFGRLRHPYEPHGPDEIMYWVQAMPNAPPGQYELIRGGCRVVVNRPRMSCYHQPEPIRRPCPGRGRHLTPAALSRQTWPAFQLATPEVGLAADFSDSSRSPRLRGHLHGGPCARPTAKQAADLMARGLSCHRTLVETSARRFTTRVFFNKWKRIDPNFAEPRKNARVGEMEPGCPHPGETGLRAGRLQSWLRIRGIKHHENDSAW